MAACGLRGVPLCFDQRNFQLDFQIVANQKSAGFQRRVPIKAEIAPLDPRRCRGAYPGIPPGILCLLRRDFYFQNHLSGHSADRQVTLQSQFVAIQCALAALEGDGWVFLDIEEIRALQVRVTGGFQRVNRIRVDHHFDARRSGILRIVYHRALHAAESTSNIGDHHVAGNELRSGVRRVNLVSRFHGIPFLAFEGWKEYLDIKIDARSATEDTSVNGGTLHCQCISTSSIMRRPSQKETMRLVARIPKPSGEAATRVWWVLRKAAHAIEQNAVRSISALSLGLSEFAVLEMLLHKGPQPVNVIGKRVLLTSGSITAAVDRLESKKLVRRTADTVDLRARIVQLTETGRRLIERAFQQHATDMEETMAVLRSSERTELARLLKKAGMWAAARLESNDDTRKN